MDVERKMLHRGWEKIRDLEVTEELRRGGGVPDEERTGVTEVEGTGVPVFP